MFQRIQDYGLMYGGGRWYRPRAYGDLQRDGTWDGWLIFFRIDGSLSDIAAPGPETTQRTWAGLAVWAADLTHAYLQGALARALRREHHSRLVDELAEAEYEVLADVERLERSAEVERTAADLDEAAARAARADLERIRRQRLATQRALAGPEETAAKPKAQTPHAARAVAADMPRRRRSAQAKATPRTRTKRGGEKRYWSRD